MRNLYVSGPEILINGQKVFLVDLDLNLIIRESGEKQAVQNGDLLTVRDRGKVREAYRFLGGKWVNVLGGVGAINERED